MGVKIMYAGAWMDTDKDTKLALSFTNNIIEMGKPEMKHTINLTVPVTPRNSEMLGWGHDAQNYGVRHMEAGMLSIDGTLIRGRIGVISCSGGRFNMLFTWGIGNTEGFNDTLQSLMWWRDIPPITYTDKDNILSNSTNTWGWINYYNSNHDNGVMYGDGGAQVSPCVNIGWLLHEAADSLGYIIEVDSVVISSMLATDCHNPYNYMFSLPTVNKRGDYFFVDVSDWYTDASVGIAPTIAVSGSGYSLADAGLVLFPSYRWVRGWTGRYFTAYVLGVTRELTIAFPQRYTELVAGGQDALDFMSAVDDNNWPTTREFTQHYDQSGSVFSFGRESEFGTAMFHLRKWKRNAFTGRCFNPSHYQPLGAYRMEVTHPGVTAAPGDSIYIRDNLPDLTFAQLLQAYCRLICACWDVDQDNHIVKITTFDNIALRGGTHVWDEFGGVQIAEGEILRYPQGWAQHNYIRAKSEDLPEDYDPQNNGWERDSQVNSDMVDDERVIAELPWYSGDNNGQGVAIFHDVDINGDGTFSLREHSGIMYIDPNGGAPLHISYIDTQCGIGNRFGKFTEQADEAAVEVLMGFADFEAMRADAVVTWKGRDWLVRSANWQDGKCTLRLLSCDFSALQ